MSLSAPSRKTKIIAVSSAGGHWVQLLRLRPAFADCDVTFVTVKESYRRDVGDAKFRVIPDGTRWNKIALLRSCLGAFWMLAQERPDVVITTGAAPGYFCVRLAKLFGARTVWLDSVANAEELSMSGQKAGRHVDLWLTQWPQLAKENGPQYRGNVL